MERRSQSGHGRRRARRLHVQTMRPLGVGTISAAIGEESNTIEEVYEPYLIQLGFLDRTPRGRVGTDRAFEYFKVSRWRRPNQPPLW